MGQTGLKAAGWVASVLLTLVLSSCDLALLPAPPETNVHLAMGNPSSAIASPAEPENYLIQKQQYTLSYNNRTRIANWVSWQLNQSWLGSVERQDDFRPDETLPAGWYQVTPRDYRGSGFDRGHWTPSADRDASVADNSATFLMTNIFPQTADNNRGPWEKLESYCRALVGQGKELYIIAGGSGARGKTKGGKLFIPARTWKVVVILERPGLGAESVTDQTRVIAVDMPNQQGIKDRAWQTYRVSVAAIEKATGHNLLSNVPSSIQTVIENRVDDR